MAQTPALRLSSDGTIDYTPSGADVIAGQVVEVGSIPMVAPAAIEDGVKGSLCNDGVWKVPQAAEIITAGDAVYWDSDGTPVTGDASSGAATGTASGNNLMGVAVATTAATDSYVYVALTAAKRTTTIAGSVTADDITGSDSSLGVAGKAGATGAGGAVAVAGGAGDSGAGGAVSATGGAGDGANAGGAGSVVGGVGGATGAGGAVSVTGGAGGATSGTGGAVAIAGGAGSNGNADGGAVSLTGGAKNGSGANGAVNIAADKACTVTIGYASGKLILVGLPTSDPSNAGEVWADSNVLTLSAG